MPLCDENGYQRQPDRSPGVPNPITHGAWGDAGGAALHLIADRRSCLDTSLKVAIIDACPARRCGVGAALTQAGFSVQVPADPLRWLNEPAPGVLVVSVDGDVDLGVVRHVSKQRPDVPVVVLLPTTPAWASREALQSGAAGVAPYDSQLEHIVAMVSAVAAGWSVLSRAAAEALARGPYCDPSTPTLTETELQWLRGLAAGATIANLARQSSYSERALYRQLANLYRRLGTSSRSAALVAAARHGLLE